MQAPELINGEEKILETLAKRDKVRQLGAMFQGVLIQIPYLKVGGLPVPCSPFPVPS